HTSRSSLPDGSGSRENARQLPAAGLPAVCALNAQDRPSALQECPFLVMRREGHKREGRPLRGALRGSPGVAGNGGPQPGGPHATPTWTVYCWIDSRYIASDSTRPRTSSTDP